jgi:putative ABC transport system permease protein
LFVPYEQHPDDFFSRMYQNVTVAVRTAGDPAAMAASFRQVVRAIDPNQPIVNLRTMDAVMAAAVTQPRFRTTLLGLFSGIALILAGIGIYGLLAHGVAQRRGEFGVRLALGATAGQLTGLVIREGLMLAVVGLVIGMAGAVFAVRLVQTMLFGVTLWDVTAWASAVVALAVVALVASWIPARRATSVDAATALRN